MITIRSGCYNDIDLHLIYKVIDSGLRSNCFNLVQKTDLNICAECEQRRACQELQSAMHHVLSLIHRNKAKS